MAVTQDIVATYKGPGRVMSRMLAAGRREDRVLLTLLVACVLFFVAQTPYQARLAHIEPDIPLQARLYWSGLFWIFFMPLMAYAITAVMSLIGRIARGNGGGASGYEVRLCLFWALLASTPVALLAGLVAGFIGPGLQLNLTLGAWAVVFGWFWISGMMAAGRMTQ